MVQDELDNAVFTNLNKNLFYETNLPVTLVPFNVSYSIEFLLIYCQILFDNIKLSFIP